MTDAPLKRCSKGDNCVHPDGPLLPATTRYFALDRGKLKTVCRECANAQKRARRKDNPEHVRRLANQLYKQHPERYAIYTQKYRNSNLEAARERDRLYREQNRETVKEAQRRWRKQNPEKERVRQYRKRARKRSLPDTFTTDDWQRVIEYFNGCCAYCGKQRDFWHSIEADHFTPLNSSECRGTVPDNMLPSCKFCNTSKQDRDPVEWIETTFGKRRAAEILARITAYFDSLS